MATGRRRTRRRRQTSPRLRPPAAPTATALHVNANIADCVRWLGPTAHNSCQRGRRGKSHD
eukprot:8250913-Lingulodinium_polyedra.AAC.1